MSSEKSPKRYVVLAIQLIVSVGLMTFVIRNIQTQDHVLLSDGKTLVGEIRPAQTKDGVELVLIESGKTTPTTVAWKDIAAKDGHVTGIRPGFWSTVKKATNTDEGRRNVMLGFITLILGYAISVVRWWMLLRAQGIPVGLGRVFRWTYIGVFFNNVMLGTTGGDVIKALYVAKECKPRARAVVSVFVDRAIGLLSLALLAGIVTSFHFSKPQFREPALFIYAILGGAAVGATVYFSQTIRRIVRFEWIISKLPLSGIVAEVDKAVLIYREVWYAVAGAIALSLCGHGLLIGTFMYFGTALDMQVAWHNYYIYCPVILILTALPIAIQGWGVSETIFQVAFAKVGVAGEKALALSLANRFAVMIFSLGGGVCLLAGSPPPDEEEGAPEEAPAEASEEDA